MQNLMNFLRSGADIQKWNCRVICKLNSSFTEISPCCFSQRLNQITLPPTVEEFLFTTFPTTQMALQFLLCAILTGVRWFVIDILIWISLTISTFLCACWLSGYLLVFLREVPTNFFYSPFFMRFFNFFLLIFISTVYILEVKALRNVSHLLWCFLVLATVYFAMQKTFNFM